MIVERATNVWRLVRKWMRIRAGSTAGSVVVGALWGTAGILLLRKISPWWVEGIVGESMMPTIDPRNDMLVIRYIKGSKHHLSNLHYGDIVEAAHPDKPGELFIKRIVGLPGDVLATPRYQRSVVRIPVGYCWLEGDNYKMSSDSNKCGPVPLATVEKLVLGIVWPWWRWKSLKQSGSTCLATSSPTARLFEASENRCWFTEGVVTAEDMSDTASSELVDN